MDVFPSQRDHNLCDGWEYDLPLSPIFFIADNALPLVNKDPKQTVWVWLNWLRDRVSPEAFASRKRVEIKIPSILYDDSQRRREMKQPVATPGWKYPITNSNTLA